MIRRAQWAAFIAGIVALAAAMNASAQTSSSSRSLASGTSSTSSTSPGTQPLGALAWIEQSRTRLGTIEPVRKGGAPDAASAVSPKGASMPAAATAKRGNSGTHLGSGLGGPPPLWKSAGGGMGGGMGGTRARTFGGISGN